MGLLITQPDSLDVPAKNCTLFLLHAQAQAISCAHARCAPTVDLDSPINRLSGIPQWTGLCPFFLEIGLEGEPVGLISMANVWPTGCG